MLTQTRTRRPARPFDGAAQDERVARARRQQPDWTITPHDGSYIVENSKGAYIVTETTCSCPDWEHRVRHIEGARCKHQIGVGNWLIEQGLSFVAPANYPEIPEGSDLVPCSSCGVLLPETKMAHEAFEMGVTSYLCPDCLARLDREAEEFELPDFDPFEDTAAADPGPAGPEDLAGPVRIVDYTSGQRALAESSALSAMLGRPVLVSAEDDAQFDRLFGGE